MSVQEIIKQARADYTNDDVIVHDEFLEKRYGDKANYYRDEIDRLKERR